MNIQLLNSRRPQLVSKREMRFLLRALRRIVSLSRFHRAAQRALLILPLLLCAGCFETKLSLESDEKAEVDAACLGKFTAQSGNEHLTLLVRDLDHKHYLAKWTSTAGITSASFVAYTSKIGDATFANLRRFSEKDGLAAQQIILRTDWSSDHNTVTLRHLKGMFFEQITTDRDFRMLVEQSVNNPSIYESATILGREGDALEAETADEILLAKKLLASTGSNSTPSSNPRPEDSLAVASEKKQAPATPRPQASPSASPGIDPALTKFLAILSGEVPRPHAEGPQSDTQKQRAAGTLAREHLVSFKGAIYELSGWNRKNKESPSTYWEMVENLRVDDVLSCEYYTEYSDMISRPFYFWHQKTPDGLDELLKKLSDDHPIRQIGPTRDNAPGSFELAMQANQESATIVKKAEEDLKKWRASETERQKNAGGGFLEWLAKCAELGIVIGLHEKERERQHYESIQQIVAASGGKKMICPECNGSGKTVHTSDGFNKYDQNPYSLGTKEANDFEERRETVHVSTCSKCGGSGVVDR